MIHIKSLSESSLGSSPDEEKIFEKEVMDEVKKDHPDAPHRLVHNENQPISERSFTDLQSQMTNEVRRLRRNSLESMFIHQDSLRWNDKNAEPKPEKEEETSVNDLNDIPNLLVSKESVRNIRQIRSRIPAESPRYVFQDDVLMSKSQFDELKGDMLSEMKRLHSEEMNRLFKHQEEQWLLCRSEPATPINKSPEMSPNPGMETIPEGDFQPELDLNDADDEFEEDEFSSAPASAASSAPRSPRKELKPKVVEPPRETQSSRIEKQENGIDRRMIYLVSAMVLVLAILCWFVWNMQKQLDMMAKLLNEKN